MNRHRNGGHSLRVLFITPPALHYIEASASERVDRRREHRPNLGILYVASYLEKMRPQYQVKVIDAASECYSLEYLGKLVQQYNPSVVAITALTFTLLDALAVAQVVKQVKPEAWAKLVRTCEDAFQFSE